MKSMPLLFAFLFVASAGAKVPPAPPVPEFPRQDPVAFGTRLKAYVDELDSGWVDEVAVSSMILIDASGRRSVRSVSQMTLEGEDGDKSLVKFRSPAEIKGVAALTHQHPGGADDSWLYLPASRRVRRISGANKTASFQGTEFTYEDLAQPALEDYEWVHLGFEKDKQGTEFHRLQATPRSSDSGYSRMVVWVHPEFWRAERTEYFDPSGELLKVMEISDFEWLHERWWRPGKMVMKNVQTRKSTEMKFSKRFLNLALYPGKGGAPRTNLSEEHFTTRKLEGR